MKIFVSIVALFLFLISCNKEVSPQFQAEVDERFSMLKQELNDLPAGTPVRFYWVKGDVNSLEFVTSSLNNEVKFEKPYLIANSIKFHVYYWQSTQNKIDNNIKNISGSEIRFYQEPR